MIKKVSYLALILVLFACEDKLEITNRYSRYYYLHKDYPIYLDARGILADIQVKSSIAPNETFKIAANDRYFFVGEKMKGIHVYKKTDEAHATPLCFIECQYIKAFDVADNLLYCNNFVDLLVIDVENPLQAEIKHRQYGYFNNYSSSSYLPVVYNQSIQTYVYEIGYKPVVLTGIETDTDPAPDFSEYDKLYENIIVTEIPDTLQVDKPFVGFANVEGNIYTFGTGGWLMQCSYADYGFEIELSLYIYNLENITPIGNLLYKDGLIFFCGFYNGCIWFDYNNWAQGTIWAGPVKDMVFIQQPVNSFVLLSKYGQTFQLQGNIIDEYYNLVGYIYGFITDATSLINVNDTVLALSNQSITLIRVYQDMWNWSFSIEKQYPFGGSSMLKEGDRLIVVNQQGLLFYDISDLENIVLIPQNK